MVLKNQKKYILSVLLCLFAGWLCKAEKLSSLITKADSLNKQRSETTVPMLYQCLEKIEEGTGEEKVKVYRLLAKYFLRKEQVDSAYKYSLLRLEWAKKNQIYDDIIMAQTDLGELLGKKGDYQKALHYLSKARELSKVSQSPEARAKILANQAYLYYLFEKKQGSLNLLKSALKLYEQVHDTMNMAYINNNLGILYKNQDRYDSALVYLKQSYIQSMILKDTLGMASACNNMGNTLSLFRDMKGAIRYLEKSLFYYQALGREEMTLYSNLGRVYTQLEQYDKSVIYFNKALELAYKQGESKKIMGLLEEISGFYREQKKWQQAFYFLSEYHDLKEREYKKELPELIDRIQAAADLKVKEKTIALLTEKNNYQALYLKNKNIVILLLVAIVLVVLGLGFSIYSHKQAENKRREIVMEQRLLRSQMNPHFFFNTLTIIQSFVVRNEAKLAGKYIAKFARLMREFLRIQPGIKLRCIKSYRLWKTIYPYSNCV
ncbi:MAG: tetratricopeptide repeat protein [Marinilabiliaceae bacterium]|nr:tetratricopeptide repeat protein [Marinilabiliaceae bacterium]